MYSSYYFNKAEIKDLNKINFEVKKIIVGTLIINNDVKFIKPQSLKKLIIYKIIKNKNLNDHDFIL